MQTSRNSTHNKPTWIVITLLFILNFTAKSQEDNRLSQENFPTISSQLNEAIEHTKFGTYKEARAIFNSLDSLSLMQDTTTYLKMLKWRAYMNKIERHFDESLADYLTLLNHYEAANDYEGIATTHNALAEFYRSRSLEKKSYEHLEAAKSLFDLHEISSCTKAFWYSRMAANESQFFGNGPKVRSYSEKALELLNGDCSIYTKGLIMNELGFHYGYMEPDNESLIMSYYARAIEAFEQENRQRDIVHVKNNMSMRYHLKDQLEKALETINPAITTAEEYEWHSALEGLYSTKMRILSDLGRFEEAFETSLKNYNSKIKMINYQYAVEVEEIETKYEKELTEKALKKAVEDASSNRRALIFASTIGVVFLIMAGIATFLTLRIRKNNQVLKTQKDTIEATNSKLSQAIDEKEILFKELNHRVKNNLMTLSGLIYMQEDQEDNPERKKIFEALRMRIYSIALVHEKLYGQDDASEIDFQQYLKELTSLNFAGLQNEEQLDFNTECENLKVPIVRAIPLAMIFNELITNVKKHTKNINKVAFEVKSKIEGDEIYIYFKDNGPGLPPGFKLSESQSMGMKIVHLMVQQLNAKFTYRSGSDGLAFKLVLKKWDA